MGMYDYIHIAHSIIRDADIRCHACKNFADSDGWQTKDFENCMGLYSLDRDNSNTVRLFSVDQPEQKYWVPYTKEEIEEYNNSSSLKWLQRKEGDGYYTKEGWEVRNRRKRFMGELPHQIVRTYLICQYCIYEDKPPKGWIEIEIKFTDGVAVKITQLEEGKII